MKKLSVIIMIIGLCFTIALSCKKEQNNEVEISTEFKTVLNKFNIVFNVSTLNENSKIGIYYDTLPNNTRNKIILGIPKIGENSINLLEFLPISSTEKTFYIKPFILKNDNYIESDFLEITIPSIISTINTKIVSYGSAQLNGFILNPNLFKDDNPTQIVFEYGENINSLTPINAKIDTIKSDSLIYYYVDVDNLLDEKNYFYRFKTINKKGTFYGNILNFKTLSVPLIENIKADSINYASCKILSTIDLKNNPSKIYIQYGIYDFTDSVLITNYNQNYLKNLHFSIKYKYRLKMYNHINILYSNIDTFTTLSNVIKFENESVLNRLKIITYNSYGNTNIPQNKYYFTINNNINCLKIDLPKNDTKTHIMFSCYINEGNIKFSYQTRGQIYVGVYDGKNTIYKRLMANNSLELIEINIPTSGFYTIDFNCTSISGESLPFYYTWISNITLPY